MVEYANRYIDNPENKLINPPIPNYRKMLRKV